MISLQGTLPCFTLQYLTQKSTDKKCKCAKVKRWKRWKGETGEKVKIYWNVQNWINEPISAAMQSLCFKLHYLVKTQSMSNCKGAKVKRWTGETGERVKQVKGWKRWRGKGERWKVKVKSICKVKGEKVANKVRQKHEHAIKLEWLKYCYYCWSNEAFEKRWRLQTGCGGNINMVKGERVKGWKGEKGARWKVKGERWNAKGERWKGKNMNSSFRWKRGNSLIEN